MKALEAIGDAAVLVGGGGFVVVARSVPDFFLAFSAGMYAWGGMDTAGWAGPISNRRRGGIPGATGVVAGPGPGTGAGRGRRLGSRISEGALLEDAA